MVSSSSPETSMIVSMLQGFPSYTSLRWITNVKNWIIIDWCKKIQMSMKHINLHNMSCPTLTIDCSGITGDCLMTKSKKKSYFWHSITLRRKNLLFFISIVLHQDILELYLINLSKIFLGVYRLFYSFKKKNTYLKYILYLKRRAVINSQGSFCLFFWNLMWAVLFHKLRKLSPEKQASLGIANRIFLKNNFLPSQIYHINCSFYTFSRVFMLIVS